MINQVINAKGISKRYKIADNDYFYAINNIDLIITKGEFVTIMGASGSGKSTLLNLISTIDLPTNGSIKLFNKDIMKFTQSAMYKFRYQYLGFIFQDYNLIDILTVKENIVIPLVTHNMKNIEINLRVNHISKKLGIIELLNKYPKECSGGQLQRAAIARALITNPQLVIADEPTGNLDTYNTEKIMNIFKKLNSEGKTIVTVSHDSMIASYADRVVYLEDGQVKKEMHKDCNNDSEFFHQLVSVNDKKMLNRKVDDKGNYNE